jgi:hypothetical protein
MANKWEKTNRLSAPFSIYFTRTATRSLQEKPDSTQSFMFLARIEILSSRRVQGITWNIQAPDTAFALLRFLY